MQFLIATYMSLKELPPAISLIAVLAEHGYDVTVLTFNDSREYKNYFGSNVSVESISQAPIGTQKKNSSSLLVKKAKGAYRYFIERPPELRRFRKRFRELTAELDCRNASKTKTWILHEYTACLLDHEIRTLPYYLSVYELPPVLYTKKTSALKRHIKDAQKVFVAEYNRAKIIEAYVGLSAEPIVLPNKPVKPKIRSNAKGVEQAIRDVSSAKASGKTTILCSGIFLSERRLEAIVEAVRDNPENYSLFLMGQRSSYLDKLEAEYPDSFTYLGFFNPPDHLPVISNIDIGVIVYEPTIPSLNTLFCAPNKIWEYSLYGKPMLVNNIPGLRYTVIDGGFGATFYTDSKESVLQSLETIRTSYPEFSERAHDFYDSVNIEEIIMSAI